MTGRTFAQINCGLLKSRKMRELGHAEKWTYLCAHLTPFATFSGVFHYPSVMWAHDACLAPDEFQAARQRLAEVGLIEFDDEEEIVRIIGFHRQRPPENASRSISLIGDFQANLLEATCDDSLVLRCVAEFTVAALARAQSWKPDSPDMPKLRDALRGFLSSVYQDAGDEFLAALSAEMESSTNAVSGELGSLLPPIHTHRPDTLSAPSGDRVGTRDVDETRPRRDSDEYEDKDETARFRDALNAEAWSRADKPDVLRSGANGNIVPKAGPLPSTLKSRLATESLRTHKSGIEN